MNTVFFDPSLVLGLTIGGRDVTGFIYDLPLPILVGLAVAAVIGVAGILGRIKAILSGKGSAMDFVTVVLILMVVALVVIIVGGRVIRQISVM